MAKAVAKAPDVALPTEYEEYGDYGYEGTGIEDYSRPIVYLLQSGSPPVLDESFEAAKAGCFYVSSTGLVTDEMTFVPVFTHQQFIEWPPRGGIPQPPVGWYEINDPVVKQAKEASTTFGKYEHPSSGNQLVQTFYLFGLVLIDPESGVWSPCVMPCASSKIKPYTEIRYKLSLLRTPAGKRFPLFAHKLKVTSTRKTNDLGTFYVPVFDFAEGNAVASRLSTADPVFAQALEFYKIVSQEQIRVVHEMEPDVGDNGSAAAADSDAPPF